MLDVIFFFQISKSTHIVKMNNQDKQCLNSIRPKSENRFRRKSPISSQKNLVIDGSNRLSDKQNVLPGQRQEQFMKKVIATNHQYLADKLRLTGGGKPSKFRLKLPHHTASSQYKKQFYAKNFNTSSQIIINKTYETNFLLNVPFETVSSYTGQFHEHELEGNPPQKENIKKDRNEPRYLDTQYKVNFVNWGVKQKMEGLKPQSSNIIGGHFYGQSAYQHSYKFKKMNPAKSSRAENFPIFTNIQNNFNTTYSHQFQKKNVKPEKPYKQVQKYQKGLQHQFKSSQYKNQFGNKTSRTEKNRWQQITIEDLQTLMLHKK